MTALREGEIAIYTRDYGVRQGFFDIDPRPLQGDDIHVIEEKLREIVGETKMTNIQKRFYKGRVALNVLANNIENAKDF